MAFKKIARLRSLKDKSVGEVKSYWLSCLIYLLQALLE